MAERRTGTGSTRTFLVIHGTAVRLSRDRADPLWEQFMAFAPGQTVTEGAYPEYADVAGWLASGHWQEVR